MTLLATGVIVGCCQEDPLPRAAPHRSLIGYGGADMTYVLGLMFGGGRITED